MSITSFLLCTSLTQRAQAGLLDDKQPLGLGLQAGLIHVSQCVPVYKVGCKYEN